jgi:dTDP-4-amino-4,6-dideoxygalactose transaminase
VHLLNPIAPDSGVARISAPSPYELRFAGLLGGGLEAVGFWKGRVALYAILRALGIGPGDEVILPGFTCVVVPNAIRLTGARPVFVDIEPDGFNADPRHAADAVSRRTRAVLLQHTFGIPAEVAPWLDFARANGLAAIEDCAHSLWGTWDGRRLGTLGDAAFFSFQWSKPYTTGLGGMAVTARPDLAQRLRELQRDGADPPAAAQLKLAAQYAAYRRLFSPARYWRAQAALRALSRTGVLVGSSSQAELEGEPPADHEWRMSARQERWGLEAMPADAGPAPALAGFYRDRLLAAGWRAGVPAPDGAPLLRFPLRVAWKEALLARAREERIELGSWFESPLHPIPLAEHARFGYEPGQCPNAERAAREVVNLPLHRRVTRAEAERIVAFCIAHAREPAR